MPVRYLGIATVAAPPIAPIPTATRRPPAAGGGSAPPNPAAGVTAPPEERALYVRWSTVVLLGFVLLALAAVVALLSYPDMQWTVFLGLVVFVLLVMLAVGIALIVEALNSGPAPAADASPVRLRDWIRSTLLGPEPPRPAG